eukprot:1283796-Alexandrium_andersonii.AAC.1
MGSSWPRRRRTIGAFRSGSASPGRGVIQFSASTWNAGARQRAGTLRLALPRRQGRPTKST